MFNINKDREEKIKLIENALDILKSYINPERFHKEQQMKKDGEHKTVLDNILKTQFKEKGLSDKELKELEKVFNQ